MATFITTIKFTEQGIQVIKDTEERANTFKATTKKMGVKVKDIYWTLSTSSNRGIKARTWKRMSLLNINRPRWEKQTRRKSRIIFQIRDS